MAAKSVSTAKQVLQELSFEHKRKKYSSVPVEWIPATKYSDSTANGLTRCIIDFLHFNGWQAERISNTGRPLDNRREYIDAVGRTRVIGSIEWIKSSGTNGTADISATIAGRSVKIEVKIGKDRQSAKQADYQKRIESAGGLYFIAKDFDSFYSWYTKTFAR